MKKKQEKLKFGTKEWSDDFLNLQLGCKNNCIYCYARSNASRRKQLSPELWGITSAPLKTKKSIPKTRSLTFMAPTTHDIFPNNVEEYIGRIEEILKKGHRVLMTSKARMFCIKKVCDYFDDIPDLMPSLEIRVSISSTDNNTLRYWEPNAPTYEERISALKYAYHRGFKTSISLEPYTDETLHSVISENKEFTTEGIWIGKMNNPKLRLKLNGEYDGDRVGAVNKILELQSDQNIIAIYNRYKDYKDIHFKESIMKIIEKQ